MAGKGIIPWMSCRHAKHRAFAAGEGGLPHRGTAAAVDELNGISDRSASARRGEDNRTARTLIEKVRTQ